MGNQQLTTDNRQFRCVIIGEGTLPLQCAEIVLNHGHAICAVVSPDARLARWAAEHGIPHATMPSGLGALLGGQPFDYLFSIVNYQVLPSETLAAPRRWAINYHDAPLPRYAGSYATSWALMARERMHGVSWHLMTEQLDAGDILVQYPIEIAADESALTLNAKCYDAALRSFAVLVADLAAGRARPQPQNLAERTFFARNRRPPTGCILDWNQDADVLAALVRALHFGPYPNPLGLAKLAFDGAFVAVAALDPLDARSGLPPGTIVAIDADALVVATATADVALRSSLTIDGAPLTIAELVAQLGLRAGQRLPGLDSATAARLAELYGQWSRHEPFWVEQLARLQPIGLPYATRAAGAPVQRQEYILSIPADTLSMLDAQVGSSRASLLVSAFALYLARLNGVGSFDLGFRDDSVQREVGDLDGFFATTLPLRVTLDMRWDFARAAQALGEQLALVRRRRSYARDIVARYPALSELRQWMVVVEVLGAAPPHPPASPPPALRLSPTRGEGEPEGTHHSVSVPPHPPAPSPTSGEGEPEGTHHAVLPLHPPHPPASPPPALRLSPTRGEGEPEGAHHGVSFARGEGEHHSASLPPHPPTPSPTSGEGEPEGANASVSLRPHPPHPPHPPAPSPTRGEGEPEGTHHSVSPTSGEGEPEGPELRLPLFPAWETSVAQRAGWLGGEGPPADSWQIPNFLRAKMIEVAREFRKDPTPSEALLWRALRGKKLDGRKFRRQQPIGPFVVDFFCAPEYLVVEVDGPIHQTQRVADQQRQQLIESLGLRFVRVTAKQVEHNLIDVLDRIRVEFLPLDPPHPPAPSPTSGEGEPEGAHHGVSFARGEGEPEGANASVSLTTKEGQPEGPELRLPLSPAWESEPPEPELRLPLSPVWERGLGGEGHPAREIEPGGESLLLQISPGGVECRLIYDPGALPPEQIEQMAQQFLMVLRSIVAQPHQSIGALPLLPEAERRRLLFDWNDTAGPFSQDRCIHELFAAQVARTPDAIAVVFGGESNATDKRQALTYRELDQRANQLAHVLQKQGVGVEMLVGIYMERSLDLIVGLLAILKAGAAYVPIDPNYPSERIAIMLEDSRAAVLLTEQCLAGRLVGPDARVVCLDERLRSALAQEPATPPISAVASGNLAYVLFTSGSTGRPKGVAIEHRSVAALIGWAEQVFTPEDLAGVLFSTSICFDLSIFELFAPLSRGGAVILVENALDLPGLATDHPITLINTVPSVIAELVRAGGVPASVRTINLAGEPLSTALVQQIYAQTTVERVFDLYGPSEDTTYSTCALRRPDGPATIGRPIANTQIYLLDSRLQPVPIGVPGELFIGGAGLARGYLNRPELTAERFVPNPFGKVKGKREKGKNEGGHTLLPFDFSLLPSAERLYRTGDLARYLPDGNIEFLGRIDHQVKVRGFRIELGEIEAALCQHPAVREAVVVARADGGSSKRLVAYVVTTDDRRPTTDDGSFQFAMLNAQSSAPGSRTLTDFLRQRLPEYMLPAAFVFLDALPLTPNGKVDRRALPAPNRADAGVGAGYVAPRNHVEEVLAGIWSQVLGVPQVGIHDNFFAIGGDSIISIQIVARASQLGLRLASRQIFQHQTIAELAGVACQAPVVQVEQGPVTGALPLTPIQHWFFEHELPERQHWNQAMLLELRAEVAPALIERSLARLVVQHDALRLRFEQEDIGWRQYHVAPGGAAFLHYENLAALSPAQQNARMADSMAAAQSSLDLASGPLLRAVLFDRGAGRSARLLLVIHHLAVDGVSWRILLDDLQALVHASPLPPKTSSFQSWAIGLEHYVRSGRLHPELDAWLALARAQSARLPLDFPATPDANRESAARSVSLALSIEETSALLHEVPAAYRVQINDVMLTALALAFAGWTGAGALLVDLEGHGREDLWDGLDLSRTVGWFTAIFPVLLEIEPGTSAVAAIGAIKEQLSYIPRRGVGYGLLRYLGDQELAAKLRALPQAEVSFNYLGQFDNIFAEAAPFRLLQEPVGPLHGPRGQRFHLIEITGQVAGGRLHMEWAYSQQLHRRATIEALAKRFMAALRELIGARHTPQIVGHTPGDVEESYQLAPGQQAMLAHALSDPTPGVYALQWRCMLHGALDMAAFQQAWQRAIERHAILRTSFVWEKQAQPLQIVHRHATALWQQHDLRKQVPAEQDIQLDALLANDQARGYDLSRPPLLRLMLVQLADDRYCFCWSYHHLLLDGWSVAPLLREILADYDAIRAANVELIEHKTRPFRDYLAWLDRQDRAAAEAFWRGYLGGAAPFRVRGSARQEQGYAEQQRRLSAATTTALRALAQRSQITLNTVVQGAKALLLSRHSGREEVIFGVTVAGRPADLEGVETIVGPFINTLPLRVAVPFEAQLLPWLRRLQAQQAELAQFDYTPLAQMLEWAGLDASAPLFETILRFQNYPLDSGLWQRAGLEIRDIAWFDRWHYPICLVVEPGAELILGATYDRRRFGDEQIAQMLEQLQAILAGFVMNFGKTLAEVLELIEVDVKRKA